MHLQTLLKAKKLVELYGAGSSLFIQPISSFYITFKDMDPDFELRLMVNYILPETKLECRMCKKKNASVRAIYRTTSKKENPKSKWGGIPGWSQPPMTTTYTVLRYKWAYICDTDCLDKFRAAILMGEAAAGS